MGPKVKSKDKIEVFFALSQIGGGKHCGSCYSTISTAATEGVGYYEAPKPPAGTELTRQYIINFIHDQRNRYDPTTFADGDINKPLFDVFAITNNPVEIDFGTTNKPKPKQRYLCERWVEDDAEFPGNGVKYKVALIPHAILSKKISKGNISASWEDLCEAAIGKQSAVLQAAYIRGDSSVLSRNPLVARLDFSRVVTASESQTKINAGFNLLTRVVRR
jgi:hypothetical protein